ncbi:uncharacterized protein LOC136059674 [Cyrtonyx montezumae]|uniref:uncharacterized protein LOC136059674 n=1 Tax=Cyrtonyx montezumae TaxID=9017 RepID=UPI0032DB5D4F
MAGRTVRSPAAWRGGAALFGKVARQEFSANVIRDEEPLRTRSLARSQALRNEGPLRRRRVRRGERRGGPGRSGTSGRTEVPFWLVTLAYCSASARTPRSFGATGLPRRQQEPVKRCFVYTRERDWPIQRSLRKNHHLVLRLGYPIICFCTSSVGRSDLLKLLPFSEANPVVTMYSSSTALLSTKLLRFFLAAPEKAVVRSSEAEDSGGPLLGRLMIADDKCAANLGLTNGFRMAVRYSPSGPSDYRARLCILGDRQLGQPPG